MNNRSVKRRLILSVITPCIAVIGFSFFFGSFCGGVNINVVYADDFSVEREGQRTDYGLQDFSIGFQSFAGNGSVAVSKNKAIDGEREAVEEDSSEYDENDADDDNVGSFDSESIKEELGEVLEGLYDSLDLNALKEFFSSGGVFFSSDLKQTLIDVTSGKFSVEYDDLISLAAELIGAKIKELSPMLISVFAIAVFYGIICALNQNSRVSGLLFNVCYCASVGVIFCEMLALIKNVWAGVLKTCAGIDAIFPLLSTLLTLCKSDAASGIFNPTCVFVYGAGLNFAVKILMPICVCVAVTSAVGSFSDKLSLNKLSAFLQSAFKWIFGVVVTVFSFFTAAGGITAAGYDGAIVKIFKYAVSGGIPFIGGFAKDSLDLILTGAVLVKNSIGIITVACMFFSVISAVLKIACFSLCLKLISALCEPICDARFSGAISSLCNALSMFTAVIIYVFILYFSTIFILLCAQGGVIA